MLDNMAFAQIDLLPILKQHDIEMLRKDIVLCCVFKFILNWQN